MIRGGSNTVEDSAEVDFHDLDPVVGVHLAQEPVPGDPGVVDDHVKTTQFVDGPLDQVLGLVVFGDVSLDGHGPPPARRYLRYDLLGLLDARAVVDGDRHAGVGQLKGDGPANAARSARDDGHLVLEVHGCSLSGKYELGEPAQRGPDTVRSRRR